MMLWAFQAAAQTGQSQNAGLEQAINAALAARSNLLERLAQAGEPQAAQAPAPAQETVPPVVGPGLWTGPGSGLGLGAITSASITGQAGQLAVQIRTAGDTRGYTPPVVPLVMLPAVDSPRAAGPRGFARVESGGWTSWYLLEFGTNLTIEHVLFRPDDRQSARRVFSVLRRS